MDRAYKVIEMAGVSAKSFEDAVLQAINAVSKAGEKISWFEVIEQRGTVESGRVLEYQIKVKFGVRL